MSFSTRLEAARDGCRTFAGDVACGLFETARTGLALLGVGVVVAVLALAAVPQLRHASEAQLTEWLTARQVAVLGVLTRN